MDEIWSGKKELKAQPDIKYFVNKAVSLLEKHHILIMAGEDGIITDEFTDTFNRKLESADTSPLISLLHAIVSHAPTSSDLDVAVMLNATVMIMADNKEDTLAQFMLKEKEWVATECDGFGVSSEHFIQELKRQDESR